MATGEQVKALIRSHYEKDQEMFKSIALQIAAHYATTSKKVLAADVRRMIERGDCLSSRQMIALPQQRDSLATSYSPSIGIEDMVLSVEITEAIASIVREYRKRDLLLARGLSPRRKLLLVGPPGCGKTMSATAIAKECGLPLMIINLHKVIESRMGDTARNLAKLFEEMRNEPGVYLLDECDALAGKRRNEASSATAESNRWLNSLLQFIERDVSTGFIIGTTNLQELLDPAIFRRFDAMISYSLPVASEIHALVSDRLRVIEMRIDRAPDCGTGIGLSHSEIVSVCNDVVRSAVLSERETIKAENLEESFRKRKGIAA